MKPSPRGAGEWWKAGVGMRRAINALVGSPAATLKGSARTAKSKRSRAIRCVAVLIALIACVNVRALAVSPPCQQVEATAQDAAANDQFGYSIAISGSVCIVGARLDDAPAANSGSAYIFRLDPSSRMWVQEAKLTASDGANGDEFGYSVAIFSNGVSGGGPFGGGGDIAVVGSRHDDDHGTDSGSAYVFQSFGSSWTQVAKLTASDGAAGDQFGYAVAICGDFLIVSARDDDAPATNSGSVYAYHYNGANWVFQNKLTASDAAANDQFGQSVSIASTEGGAGAVAIIGAWHDDSPLQDAGSAYIFRFKSKTQAWTQGAKLTSSDPSASNEFGNAVSISTTPDTELAIVGERFNDDSGINSGAVHVFRHVDASWIDEAKLAASDGAQDDQFGQSVGIWASNDTAVIGAWHNDQAGTDAGAAYVFHRDPQSGAWFQAAKLVPVEIVAGDTYGACVAISGDRAAVGAYQADSPLVDAGAAFMYAGVSGVDANGNGMADGCDLIGDVNSDGIVNGADIAAIFAAWGACPAPPAVCPADLNGDGIVNMADLLIVLNHWT